MMATYDADVIAAAVEVVRSLDGTYGKSWPQVAGYLEKWGQEGEQYYADPTALAGLVRALVAYGALDEEAREAHDG